MIPTECAKCERSYGREQIKRLEGLKEITCPHLYTIPNRATNERFERFVSQINKNSWDFLLVRGSVGAGKSAFISMLKNELRKRNLAISHTVIKEAEDLKKIGITTFIPYSLIHNLRLYENGEEKTFLEKLEKDDNFKRKVNKCLKDNEDELRYTGSRALTLIFDALTEDDKELNRAAMDWLYGYVPSREDERGKERLKRLREMGLETKQRSIATVTTGETLFFLRTLVQKLGYECLAVIVDEVEKIGDLPGRAGRQFLSGIRDLINLLYQSETDIPVQKGIFVIVSISDQYLYYSGVTPDVPPETSEVLGREIFYKPKSDLRDVPRLATILKNIKSYANVIIEDKEKMITLGEKICNCYAYAYLPTDKKCNVNVRGVVEKIYSTKKWLLPRMYIPEIIEAIKRA